jgi:uncharacterized protein (TIGR03067 family)
MVVTRIGMAAIGMTLAAWVSAGAFVPDRQPIDPQPAAPGLTGRWKQIYVEFEGVEQKLELQFNNHWNITPETITIRITLGAGERDSGSWRYKLHPELTPAGIDLTTETVTYPSIYLLEGNRLIVCLQNYPARGRPKDFASRPNSGIGKFIYERVAP